MNTLKSLVAVFALCASASAQSYSFDVAGFVTDVATAVNVPAPAGSVTNAHIAIRYVERDTLRWCTPHNSTYIFSTYNSWGFYDPSGITIANGTSSSYFQSLGGCSMSTQVTTTTTDVDVAPSTFALGACSFLTAGTGPTMGFGAFTPRFSAHITVTYTP